MRFRLPAGVSGETVAAEAQSPVETTAGEATIRTADPQRVLYRLTGWAEREGRRLEELEVVRPRLDDMFVELVTAEANRD